MLLHAHRTLLLYRAAPGTLLIPAYQSPFIIFKLNSTPTNVAAYISAHTHPILIMQMRPNTVLLTFAGNALAIAGPKPFHSAATPSAAINFRAQSMNPE